MSDPTSIQPPQPPRRSRKRAAGEKLRDADKVELIPVKLEQEPYLRKPSWIKVRLGDGPEVNRIKSVLRKHKLATVCEEASCPNLGECFGGGTATFMIMGEICTRRCPFCDVAHGKPLALDSEEPRQLAEAIEEMALKYVVVTSVDRDDLRDGGAQHFADCIREIRERCPETEIEVLTPDFRGRMDVALEILAQTPPDVFNHNLESVPQLYRQVRPGADYAWSLQLLQKYKALRPEVLTKSGLMVGMGETEEQIMAVIRDLRAHDVEMLTIGQYLQPSKDHYPLQRYVEPDEFRRYSEYADEIGFTHVASGPLVRSSYHADQQAKGIKIA